MQLTAPCSSHGAIPHIWAGSVAALDPTVASVPPPSPLRPSGPLWLLWGLLQIPPRLSNVRALKRSQTSAEPQMSSPSDSNQTGATRPGAALLLFRRAFLEVTPEPMKRNVLRVADKI